MFSLSASGSPSQARPKASKADYVPSAYIASQLKREEEARHLRQGDHSTAETKDHHSDDSAKLWPGPEEVLAPGYSSGQLGYSVSPYSAQPSKRLFDDASFVNNTNSRTDVGSGFGISGDHFQGTRPAGNTESTSKLYPDLYFGDSPLRTHATTDQASFSGSAGRGVLKTESRMDLDKGDHVLKKHGSVRFPGLDMGTPRPMSPSIFNQSVNPFFTGSNLQGSGLANSHSSLQETGKVDVLTYRMAPNLTGKNGNLGPALGSVLDTAGARSGYATSSGLGRTMAEQPSTLARDPSLSSTTAGSSYFLGQDGSARRTADNLHPPIKDDRDEEEEDKNRERYMPRYLFNSTHGPQGSKIEPFADENGGKAGWDNEPFQQTGPKSLGTRDMDARLAPHMIGEDAPPADTLFDVARKEGYYARPTATLSQVRKPEQDVWQDTEMSNAMDSTPMDAPYTSIITYGFPAEAASYMLNQFRSFGIVTKHQTGTSHLKEKGSIWLKIQYDSAWSAKNARSRHLKAVGKFLVGVHPCPSFSMQGPVSAEEDVAGPAFSVAEERAMDEGLDALRATQLKGAEPFQSQLAGAGKGRPGSLYESWSQGGASVGPATDLGQSFGASNSEGLPLSDSVLEGSVVRKAGDAGDEDMAYILGHSLTSGSFLRPRGREDDREVRVGAIQSRSKDQPGSGGFDQDAKRGFGESAFTSSQRADSMPVGFRPLFGEGASRSLYAGMGQDRVSKQGQTEYLHQQQQREQEQLHSSHGRSLRQKLGESTFSEGARLGSSLTEMASVGSGSTMTGSPFHVQKKQRLTLQGFSASAPAPSMDGAGGGSSSGLFGGQDKSSQLVDDPALVDDQGRRKNGPAGSLGLGTRLSASAVNPGPASTPHPNGAASESMLSSVVNMAKKRLFWG